MPKIKKPKATPSTTSMIKLRVKAPYTVIEGFYDVTVTDKKGNPVEPLEGCEAGKKATQNVCDIIYAVNAAPILLAALSEIEGIVRRAIKQDTQEDHAAALTEILDEISGLGGKFMDEANFPFSNAGELQ